MRWFWTKNRGPSQEALAASKRAEASLVEMCQDKEEAQYLAFRFRSLRDAWTEAVADSWREGQ